MQSWKKAIFKFEPPVTYLRIPFHSKGPSLPRDWEKMQMILAPVCAASHWSLLAYCPSSNTVTMYSSMEISEVEVSYAQVGHSILCMVAVILKRFDLSTSKCLWFLDIWVCDTMKNDNFACDISECDFIPRN